MSQTPYTPLTDILCMIISDCNRVHVCATFDVILAQLNEYFSTIQQPSEAIVYGTLDQLLKDRKIYHSGKKRENKFGFHVSFSYVQRPHILTIS